MESVKGREDNSRVPWMMKENEARCLRLREIRVRHDHKVSCTGETSIELVR